MHAAAATPAPGPDTAQRKPPFWLGFAISAPQVWLLYFTALIPKRCNSMAKAQTSIVHISLMQQLLYCLRDSQCAIPPADRGSKRNGWEGPKHLGHICRHSWQDQGRLNRYMFLGTLPPLRVMVFNAHDCNKEGSSSHYMSCVGLTL